VSPLNLYNTSVHLNFFAEAVSISKKTIMALCEILEKGPLPTHCDIQWLYLRGDRYFRKVRTANVIDLEEKEIDRATSVTPICEGKDLPFLLTSDQLEVYLSTEKLTFEGLTKAVREVAAHFGHLAGYGAGMRIELPLRGAFGGRLSNLIYKQILPKLPAGNYGFEVLWNKKTDQGEIALPKTFEELPASIRQIANVIRSPYAVRMTTNGSRFVVSCHKLKELGVILSAANLDWFLEVMQICREKGAFRERFEMPASHRFMPTFGTVDPRSGSHAKI